MDMSKM